MTIDKREQLEEMTQSLEGMLPRQDKSTKMQKPATRKQRKRIRTMLERDQISFELAQAIIEGSAHIVVEKKPDTKQSEQYPEELLWRNLRACKYFDFDAMTKVLKSFSQEEPRLGSEADSAAVIVKKHVFWRRCTGVRTISVKRVELIYDCVTELFEIGLIKSMRSEVKEEIGEELSDYVCNSGVLGKWRKLVPSVKKIGHTPEMAIFWTKDHGRLGTILWDLDDSSYGALFSFEGDTEEIAVEALKALLYYYCYTSGISKHKRQPSLKALVEVVQSGLLPVGFDKEDNLVVLVA
jgi:hypothetical protein